MRACGAHINNRIFEAHAAKCIFWCVLMTSILLRGSGGVTIAMWSASLLPTRMTCFFCTRDCCVEKIAPKHFLTVCAGRHNDRIILAALTFVHGQRISQRECAPNFGAEELRLAVRGERNVNKRAAALHRLNMRRANVAVEAARSSRLFLRIMVRSFSRTVVWPKRGAAS